MKAMKNLFVLLTLVSVIGVGSCKDDDPSTCNYASELQDEVNAYSAAAEAYFADIQNVAKCNAYKDALQDYINEAQGLQSCANAAGQGTEYQQALQAAEDSLDAFQC
jgi:hypothetical protein